MFKEDLKKMNPEIRLGSEEELNELLKELEEVDCIVDTNLIEMGEYDPERDSAEILGADPEQREVPGFMLKTYAGNFLIREAAIQSVESRADCTCRLISTLFESGRTEDAVSLINMALRIKEKIRRETETESSLPTAKIYLRAGRVIGSHSDRYAAMSQREIFREVFERIREDFPSAKFESATYTHDLTEVVVSLGDYTSEIMETYRLNYEKFYGTAGLETMKPVIRVCTSDTGLSSVSVLPVLSASHNHLLGERLQSRHYGKNSLEDVKRNLKLAFAKARDTLEELSGLMAIELEDPIAAMVRAMEYGGKKGLYGKAVGACESTLATFSLLYEGCPATAFDVYSALCEMEYCDAMSKLSKVTAIQVVEGIYRTIGLDWEAIGCPGKHYLGDGVKTKKKGGRK